MSDWNRSELFVIQAVYNYNDADKQLHSKIKMSLKYNCIQAYIVEWLSLLSKNKARQ